MAKERLQVYYFLLSFSFHLLSFLIGFLLLSGKSLYLSVAPSLVIAFSTMYFFSSTAFINALLLDKNESTADVFKNVSRGLSIATLISLAASLISYNYYVGFVNV